MQKTSDTIGYDSAAFLDFFAKTEGTRWTNEHHASRQSSVESGAKSGRHS